MYKKNIGLFFLSILSISVIYNYSQRIIEKKEKSISVSENYNTLPFTLNHIQSNFSNAQAIKYCRSINMRTANQLEIQNYYILNSSKFSVESPGFTIGDNVDLELNSYYPKEKSFRFNSNQDNYTLCVDNDILRQLK